MVSEDLAVLEDEIVSSGTGGFQRLIVHWKRRPQADDTGVDTNYN